MSWETFPVDEFERYVRAMPQGEAQTALIFLVNFLAQKRAAEAQREMDEMNGLT